jgi:hypothetical protein
MSWLVFLIRYWVLFPESSKFFSKNSGYLVKFVNLKDLFNLVSFGVFSNFTYVPVDEELQMARNKLQSDNPLWNVLSCRPKPLWKYLILFEEKTFL